MSSNETFSALLALCVGNSPVTGGLPSQRPVTRSFNDLFDLCQNKRLSKQSRRRWFETPWHSYWRHCNANEAVTVAKLVHVPNQCWLLVSNTQHSIYHIQWEICVILILKYLKWCIKETFTFPKDQCDQRSDELSEEGEGLLSYQVNSITSNNYSKNQKWLAYRDNTSKL